MVKESGLLDRVGELLAACRRAGLPVIHVVVQFRPGHPEIGRTTRMFGGIRKAGSLIEGTWGAAIHEAVRPLPDEPVVVKRGVSAFHGNQILPFLATITTSRELITAIEAAPT